MGSTMAKLVMACTDWSRKMSGLLRPLTHRPKAGQFPQRSA